MLYIVYKKDMPDTTWHINTPVRWNGTTPVDFLQIDGGELEHVRRLFPALIPTGKQTAIIPQPFADLILHNL